ncbi:MAG: SDR family NAD(P)-dependent oxidoreductase [Desulfatibacillaceae bacterium]
MGRVDGKVAIVTGGAKGIGEAVCELLAAEGASVAVCDLDVEQGTAVADRIKERGQTAIFRHLDVTGEDQVKDTVKEIVDRFGRLDVMVANAGIAGPNKPTHEVTREEWLQVMDVNVNGVFYCTKYSIEPMEKSGGGSIINLSSIYGLVSAPDIPPYHASKGAVRLMTKTDALLYADRKIRVNSVHPGYIWTPLVEELAVENGIDPAEFKKDLDSRHPIGHVGEPVDIANGVLYLASDESKFVTGSELVIDGGYTAQ